MISLAVYTSEPLSSLALSSLFEPCEDISLLATLPDIARFTEEVARSRPDVILVSVDGNVDWGLLDRLRRASPESRLVLWLHQVPPELAYNAIEFGVRGILRKSLPPDMIPKCVRKVYAGELWFDKTLTETFLSGRAVKVSRRENELITLVSQGLKNKEIASVMAITEGTVKVYLSRLFEKIGVRDRYELALFGLRASPHLGDGANSSFPVLKSVFVAATTPADPVRKSAKTQPVRLLSSRVVH